MKIELSYGQYLGIVIIYNSGLPLKRSTVAIGQCGVSIFVHHPF